MKRAIILVVIVCCLATAITLYFLGGIDPERLRVMLQRAGIWAPILYIGIYVLATALVLPSTVLNLLGGALFGPWLGTLWTSLAAVIAAVITFAFTRTMGQEWVARKLGGQWQVMDVELRQGGVYYMFAIRLLPIIPYGLVNFAAGLTSISLRDYTLGTILGTVPGVLPFVLLGSSGIQAMQTGEMLPLIAPLGIIGLLTGTATWFRRHRTQSHLPLKEHEQSAPTNKMD